MKMNQWIAIQDIEAIIIPSGVSCIIYKGTLIDIIRKQNSYIFININNNLMCIKIHQECTKNNIKKSTSTNKITNTIKSYPDSILNEIWHSLTNCFDPEISVNVVDLGLIYDIKVNSNKNYTKHHVYITMTLTSPGCGMGDVIIQDIKNSARQVSNVTDVTVKIVFEPIWNKNMISESGKLNLGLL